METNQTNIPQPQDNNQLGVMDILNLCLSHWRWFLLSGVVIMGLAVLYLKSTPLLYTRHMSVLIKENRRTNNGMAALSKEFESMGNFMGSSSDINNELLVMRSPMLMDEVVRRLKLNESYVARFGLRKQELYTTTPVLVGFADPETAGFMSFTLTPLSPDSVSLSEMVRRVPGEGSIEYEGELRFAFGDTVETPAGGLCVNYLPEGKPDYIGHKIWFTRTSVKGKTNQLMRQFSADRADKLSTVINMNVECSSVRMAEDILNTIVDVYNENWILDRNEISISTSGFITERLDLIEDELGNVDENISSYKSENLVPDVKAASQMFLNESAANKKSLLDLNTQLSTARYIRKILDTKDVSRPLPSGGLNTESGLHQMVSDYNTTLLERNRLLANSSESNPVVMDMTQSLYAMQSVIVQSVDNVIVSINHKINELKVKDRELNSQLASSPQQAKDLLSVERQQKIKEQLYLYLLQKREENELGQAFTAYNTRVITQPRGSSRPSSPERSKILLVAFLIAICLPAVAIYLSIVTNTTVRGRKDLDHLQVPFLGEIPLSKDEIMANKWYRRMWIRRSRRHEAHPIVVREQCRDMQNEAFRVVRTNFEFMNGAGNEKVVVVTSLNPGSGKTFLTLNIAKSLAIKNKKVMLVDMDMRKGSLSEAVDKPSRGLSGFLAGRESDWRSLVVQGQLHANLDVMPLGSIPPNPTELLFSDSLETMIEEMRHEYDYIFIDSAPMDIVADTSIIAKWADRCVFVVRAGLMERELLPTVQHFYTEKVLPNMCVLLNATQLLGTGKYGYHRYGYHYGYGYGYGHGYGYGYGYGEGSK